MSCSPTPPIYVAYRRPDADRVDALVDALAAELGPPPAGLESWFFLDRRSIRCGHSWYYSITEAHHAATCILGVMSARTMPRTRAESHKHGIYLDELFQAQASGRLIPVRIDEGEFELLYLGLGMTQCSIWTGHETQTIKALADQIRAWASHDASAETDPMRTRWKTHCVDEGHVDQLIEVDSSGTPMILRPVPDPINGGILAITKWPVRVKADCSELGSIVEEARRCSDLDLRLPFINEAKALLAVPAKPATGWKHPLDLALGKDSGGVWVLDPYLKRIITISLTDGESDDASVGDLWLVMGGWA